MKHESELSGTMVARRTRTAMALAAASLTVATATASAQPMSTDDWRVTAAAGGFVPRSAMIVSAEGRDTRLVAGPSFSLGVEYIARDWAAIYAGGTAAFSRVALGSQIQGTAVGPSDQVTLLSVTAGVLLGGPTAGIFGERLYPTLRLGGGIKGYAFDLDDVDGQSRPTGDFGLGFRGAGNGPIEVSAEVRYLPSSFDQSKLPTQGIRPQTQRQTDLLFTVGVSVRP